MATNNNNSNKRLEAPHITQFQNVTDRTHYDDGTDINNLKTYGDLSENAMLVWQPQTFTAFGRMMHMTNGQICTLIKEYYAQTFHDLRGVMLHYYPTPTGTGNFVMELCFSKNPQPCPDGKIENLTDLTINMSGSRNIYAARQVSNNRALGKHYTLNEKTKLLLADVMYGGKDNKTNKPESNSWASFIQERPQPVTNIMYPMQAVEMLVWVSGCFDFHRVLKKVFGSRMVIDTVMDENGKTKNVTGNAVYKARFINYKINQPAIFTIQIEQFDPDQVKKMAEENSPFINQSGPQYF